MNNEPTTTWELLAEELAPESLSHLTGGTREIGTMPNDLVTPADEASTYNGGDPDEAQTAGPG